MENPKKEKFRQKPISKYYIYFTEVQSMLVEIIKVNNLKLGGVFEKKVELPDDFYSELTMLLFILDNNETEIEPKQFSDKIWKKLIEEDKYLIQRDTASHSKIAYIYLKGIFDDKVVRFKSKEIWEWWFLARKTLNNTVVNKGIEELNIISENNSLSINLIEKDLTAIWTDTNAIPPTQLLEKISNKLNTESIVIIEGIGGCGKSTIANLYLQQNYSKYNHVAWLEIKDFEKNGHIDEADRLFDIAKQFKSIGTREGDYASKELYFLGTLSKLKGLPGHNLLIIDNAVPALGKYLKYLNLSSNTVTWQVLITTRYRFQEIKGNAKIQLKGMSEDLAIKVFNRYRNIENKVQSESDLQLLRAALNACQRHPLIIKLLALLALHNDFELPELNNVLKKEGLLLDKQVKIAIEDEILEPSNFILRLFPLLGITQSVQKVLMFFSVQRQDLIPASHIEQLTWEGQQVVGNSLFESFVLGWLDRFKNNQKEQYSFSMHSLIKEVVRDKYPLTIENATYLIEGIKNGMGRLQGQAIEIVEKTKLVDYAVAVFNAIYSPKLAPTIDYIVFVNTIANRYGKDLHDFTNAFYYSNIALAAAQQLVDSDPSEDILRYIAIIYKNRAMYCINMANAINLNSTSLSPNTQDIYKLAMLSLKNSNDFLERLKTIRNNIELLQNLREYRRICLDLYRDKNLTDTDRQYSLGEISRTFNAIESYYEQILSQEPTYFLKPQSYFELISYINDGIYFSNYLSANGNDAEIFAILEKRYKALYEFIEGIRLNEELSFYFIQSKIPIVIDVDRAISSLIASFIPISRNEVIKGKVEHQIDWLLSNLASTKQQIISDSLANSLAETNFYQHYLVTSINSLNEIYIGLVDNFGNHSRQALGIGLIISSIRSLGV